MNNKPHMLVGIIGGKGLIGRMMKKFFVKNKCRVIISDTCTKLTNKDLAKRCDVVVVSVPISLSVTIINEVRRDVRNNALLMDVTSLKERQLKAMMKSKCSVLGFHPMFGPGASSFKGQTVVLCKGRGIKWFKWFNNLLHKEKATVTVVSADKHDKFMAVIQGLLHFNSIATVHSMKELGFDVKESLNLVSPVYRIQMDMLGRILNHDAKLHAEIISENPNINAVLQSYVNSVEKLQKIVNEKSGFEKLFKDCAEYLGDFKIKAEKESNYLIGQLTK